MKKNQFPPQDRPLTLPELLAAPMNSRKTRRILEFYHPMPLFVEIDEKGIYHIIGIPGVPGHFQVGIVTKQKWTPAPDQSMFIWQTREELHGCLHLIERNGRASADVIALIQHNPTYRHIGKTQILDDIHSAMVTPLWSDETSSSNPVYLEKHTYRCSFSVPCGCDLFTLLRQTYDYQQWTMHEYR